MIELKNRFSPSVAIILTNSASAASFIFYSSKLQFYPDRTYVIKQSHGNGEETMKYLNNLKTNQKYWLFLNKDYLKDPIFPTIDEWLVDKKVLYKKQERGSYLIYVQN